MNPERQLDALVAVKVMGWAWVPIPEEAKDEIMNPALVGPMLCPPGEHWATGYKVPMYSTDISAAWEVVEKLWYDGVGRVECGPVTPRNDWNRIEYFCEVYSKNYKKTLAQEYSETAPHAICLAALKAVGVVIN